MIIAMMYPSSARIFQTYASVLESTDERIIDVSVIIVMYTLVWITIGTVPLLIAALVPTSLVATMDTSIFFGSALVLLSVYQLSPYKQHCLERCRAPETMLPSDHASGIGFSMRFSANFSRDDIGSCWVWMGFMIIVGSMNFLWMGVITIFITFEQLGPNGNGFAKAVGLVSLLLGLGMMTVYVL
jgi:predicted metal-binding membrane protein